MVLDKTESSMYQTLDNCNMEKIYGDLFQALTVKILEIKDTPIKDISENTFMGAIADGMKVRNNVFVILKYISHNSFLHWRSTSNYE